MRVAAVRARLGRSGRCGPLRRRLRLRRARSSPDLSCRRDGRRRRGSCRPRRGHSRGPCRRCRVASRRRTPRPPRRPRPVRTRRGRGPSGTTLEGALPMRVRRPSRSRGGWRTPGPGELVEPFDHLSARTRPCGNSQRPVTTAAFATQITRSSAQNGLRARKPMRRSNAAKCATGRVPTRPRGQARPLRLDSLTG